MNLRAVTLLSLAFALACSGGSEPAPAPAPAPAPEPEPESEAEEAPVSGALEGYTVVPGKTGQRFVPWQPKQVLYTGVDAVELRDEPHGTAVATLRLGTAVTVVDLVGEAEAVDGLNQHWVEIESDALRGVVHGSQLTPYGGDAFFETAGEGAWGVVFGPDLTPRVSLRAGDDTVTLDLRVTDRFQGGTLVAELSTWGDWDPMVTVTQCAAEDPAEGPRCATGIAVYNDGLGPLTPPDAWRFSPAPERDHACAQATPLATEVLDSPEVVEQVVLPSYMRGPSTDITCTATGRVTEGEYADKRVVSCDTTEGSKETPTSLAATWFLELQPGEWARLPCDGDDAELENHLGYSEIKVVDIGSRRLDGVLARPEVLYEDDKGRATFAFQPPGTLDLSELEPVYEHPVYGQVYRARARHPADVIWTTPALAGQLVLPRPEGGAALYSWTPASTEVTLDDGTALTYASADPMGADLYWPGIDGSKLVKVGTAGEQPVYTLPDDAMAMVAARMAFPDHQVEQGPPFVFVEGPFGGHYLWIQQSVVRPLMAEPILYAMADVPTALSVRFGAGLQVRGTHPPTRDGWDLVVHPDGTLLVDGTRHDRLFWDGVNGRFARPERGWVVPGDAFATSLEALLPTLGLRGREVQEAIEAWSPAVADAAWVRVGVHEAGTIARVAPLELSPAPDALIRVLVELEPLTAPASMLPPTSYAGDRESGLTVVEWGYVVRPPAP